MEDPVGIHGRKHAKGGGHASFESTSGKYSDPTDDREARSTDSMSPLRALSAQIFPVLRNLLLGYGILSSHSGAQTGPFMSWLGYFLALYAVVSRLIGPITFLIDQYLVSTISVESDSDPYVMFISWASKNSKALASRKAFLQTAFYIPPWRDYGMAGTGIPFDQDASNNNGGRGRKYANYSPDPSKVVEPISMIFQEARRDWNRDATDYTKIFRPSDPELYGVDLWQNVARRPVRSMESVIVDEQVKARVLDDMNKYLLPQAARWYADRGIPLRRGYGFFGPPGTGKTSFASACAATFGIPIYVLSLHDASLTESRFTRLVNDLPRKSILLLEDIDTAGIRRDGDGTKSETKDGEKKQAISLSGLLNAIDGVASQEGRILIMTANKPELLDEALVRPGRVDIQVHFENASASQAAEQFRVMYQGRAPQQLVDEGNESDAPTDKEKMTSLPDVPEMTKEKLEALSQQFASQIPDRVFSHAEIQNFLLEHRDDAIAAAEKAGRWAKDLKERKESKR
ncbi:hypothetical protein E4U42_002507 [Claviceps africana]|uniref:AAA+ ATPase domain-containing protein n=1 Tax=Claviceps africana TaxID=83212 RepID=A0A8K0J876_9HYPO|nr:hypothetical protein E4U42_002507 [Claviceps africana]